MDVVVSISRHSDCDVAWCTSPHTEVGDPLFPGLFAHQAVAGRVELGGETPGAVELDIARYDWSPGVEGESVIDVSVPCDLLSLRADEAEAIAHALLVAVQRLELAKRGAAAMTWDVAMERHLDWCRMRGYSDAGLYMRRRSLMRFRTQLGFDPLVAQETDLRRWQMERSRAVTPSTVGTETALVRAFYRWCLDEDLLERDPSRRLQRPRVPKRLPRPIPEDYLRRALLNSPPRLRPFLVLAAWAGLRASEIANLQREDILDPGVVEVPALVVRQGKGDKDRIVTMAPEVWAELEAYGLPATGYVFLRGDGQRGPNAPHRVSGLCNRYLKRQGIPYSLHKLRHRFATRLYQISNDILAVQNALGHSSPNTTQVYAAFSPTRGRDAVEQLGRTLSSPSEA